MTYADTGRPAAHAEVHVGIGAEPGGVREGGVRYLTAEADADGRFRVSVMPGDRHQCLGRRSRRAALSSAPAKELEWPKGATEQAVDLALPRGVLIRGKVTEEGTGQPVADAMVCFGRMPSERPAPRAADWP